MLSARLDPKRVQPVLERLAARQRDASDNARRSQRFDYHQATNIVVTIFHPQNQQVRYAVVARNLSETGLAFLHGGYMHIGTQCVAALETASHQWVRVVGDVARCRHVEANIHEIGLHFRDRVQIKIFLNESSAVRGDEQTLVPKLNGRAIYVDDSIDDRELMRFLLNRIGVKAIVTASAEEAIEFIDSGVPVDMVVTDHQADGIDGVKLIRTLRERNQEVPVIVVSADDAASVQREVLNAGCEAMLTKPVQLDQIANVLLQFLPLSESGRTEDDEPIQSTLWSDKAMQPLILNFLSRLEEQVKAIEQSVASDRPAAIAMLSRLKGTAGGYGYPQITHVLQRIVSMHKAGDAEAELVQQINQALTLCRRACEVRKDIEK